MNDKPRYQVWIEVAGLAAVTFASAFSIYEAVHLSL